MNAPTWQHGPLLGLDLETSGLDPERHALLEWGWALSIEGRVEKTGGALVRPEHDVDPAIIDLTGLDPVALAKARPLDEQIDAIADAMLQAPAIVAYNVSFDRAFLQRAFFRAGRTLPEVRWLDPMPLLRSIDRAEGSLKLSAVCARWGIRVERPHRAPDDARAVVELLLRVGDHLDAVTLAEAEAALEAHLRGA